METRTSFRPLNADEMELLKKLLDHDFPGRDVLRRQLSSVTGRQVDENGSIELKTAENERAEVQSASPTEGTCADIDGVPIAVMLHVKEGKLHLLEIFKEDGSEIQRAPKAETLAAY
jgi:hypothetical protein